MRKRYFVRLIAVIPMLAVAISMVVFLAFAVENLWWILLAIGNFWALRRICLDFEWCVRDIARSLKETANDALL